MNKKIKKDVSNITDNLIKSNFSAVQYKINNNEGVILKMETEKKKKKINFKQLLLAPTAVLATITLVMILNPNHDVVTTVTMDVNPSVELGLDKNGVVREVNAINGDADTIINDIDIKNKSIETATKEVVTEMVKDEFITADKNSVLVTGTGDNASKVVEEVNTTVNNELKNNNIDSSVITQVVDTDKELEEQAKKYGISVGKLELINKIIASNSKYTVDILKGLTTNDLNLLVNSKINTVNDVVTNGNASTKGYISKDEALNIATTNANINVNNLTDKEIEFDNEDGIMIYEVEFDYKNLSYEYDIDAKTGNIISKKFETEDGNEIDDNDDYDDIDDDNDDFDGQDDDNDDFDGQDDDNDDFDDQDDDNDDFDDDNDDNDDFDDVDDQDDDKDND